MYFIFNCLFKLNISRACSYRVHCGAAGVGPGPVAGPSWAADLEERC